MRIILLFAPVIDSITICIQYDIICLKDRQQIMRTSLKILFFPFQFWDSSSTHSGDINAFWGVCVRMCQLSATFIKGHSLAESFVLCNRFITNTEHSALSTISIKSSNNYTTPLSCNSRRKCSNYSQYNYFIPMATPEGLYNQQQTQTWPTMKLHRTFSSTCPKRGSN